MSTTATPEPAIKSYFFGKGYADLRSTIIESWERNLASAQSEFAQAGALWPGDYPAKGFAILRGTAGIAVVLFGTAVFLLFSMVHITVLLTFFLLIYIGFSLVYLSERAYLALKQFFTVCPACHSKRPLPDYFCPKCGAVHLHRRLIPSSYGILHRTCQCGQSLPTTFFLKRGELPSKCPDCNEMLEAGHTEARKAFLPVFGGPSVGKSAFLFSAVRQIVEEEAPRLGLQTSFLESRTESDFQRICQQLSEGRPPDKTLSALPRAFNLKLQKSGQSPRVLYLYDPAGEAFNEIEGMVLHRYQEYLSGLVFLIDPFTIPAVRAEYSDRMAAVESALNPSRLPVEDALSRILISLEENFGLTRGAQLKAPLAVVLNKVDAFDLEQRIGEPAVQARVKSSSTPLDPETARNQLLREQLIRWDLGGLVQQLETRCARIRYFTCSSLGHMPDASGRAFEARGVLEPVMWILSAADAAFAANRPRKAA
jgi:hypothetical protein